MTSAQVVETSVKVTPNSPSQDYTHPDDHNFMHLDTLDIIFIQCTFQNDTYLGVGLLIKKVLIASCFFHNLLIKI